MAYKRTSKKSGSIRSTQTINTNGNITNSTSTGSVGKSGGVRTTTSWSTKGGMRQTQTYKDGAGYIHKKTTYKSTTPAERAREAKRNQQFWAMVFGGKKTKRKAAAPSGIRSFFGWAFIIIIGLMLINLK
jgi:hypothetical protein